MSWFTLSIDPVAFSYSAIKVSSEGLMPELPKLVSELGVEYLGVIYFIFLLGLFFGCFYYKEKNLLSSLLQVACVLFTVLGVYMSFLACLLWTLPVDSVIERVRDGSFGDSFGTLNTLFSGLAFSGVIITIFMQKADLVDTRKQNGKQQTESQFYNLFNLQQQVINGFDLHIETAGSSIKTVQGRDCFRNWRKKLDHRYQGLLTKVRNPSAASQQAYQSVLKSHLGDLGLYFRSLYAVFRFIDTVAIADRRHFALVVRSLLSDYELLFLFYNCLSPKGERFVKYAEQYALFDNLDVLLLLNKVDVALMDVSVYGQNQEALSIHASLSVVK